MGILDKFRSIIKNIVLWPDDGLTSGYLGENGVVNLYKDVGLNGGYRLDKLVREIPAEPAYAKVAKFKRARRSDKLIHNVKLSNPGLVGIRWAVYGIQQNLAIGTTSRRIAREIADGNPVVRVLLINHKKGTCTISAKV